LSASVFYATAVEVQQQVNAQLDTQNKRSDRLKVFGHDVRVPIYTNIGSDCIGSTADQSSWRLLQSGAVIKRTDSQATNLKQCLAAEAPAFVARRISAAPIGSNGGSFFRRPRSDFQITVPRGRRTANLNRDVDKYKITRRGN
jgi:hypothetical protein